MLETLTTAKLFRNGNSQALRLPKAFRFSGEEVVIYRQNGKVVLAEKLGQWGDFFVQSTRASEDFLLRRGDEPPQSRELL